MDANFFWDLFMETGAPEAYLFFRREKTQSETAEHMPKGA